MFLKDFADWRHEGTVSSVLRGNILEADLLGS